MQLRKLTIKKMYGYMDKEINFSADINLIVGINGSGKTSVLNVINWILTPDMGKLCTTEFKEIKISFTLRGSEYSVTCSQTSKKLQININGATTFNPLSVMLQVPPSEITTNPHQYKGLAALYMHLTPDQKEVEAWQFLLGLPKPSILGLDRAAAFSDVGAISFADPTKRSDKSPPSSVGQSPTEKVKELTTRHYSRYRDEVITLNNVLKNSIMMSSFDVVTDVEDIHRLSSRSIKKNQVLALQKKVDRFFASETTAQSERSVIDNYGKITEYFKYISHSIDTEKAKMDKDSALLYFINCSQFKRIKTLVQAFERFDEDSSKAFARFRTYLETVNKYFKDTSKEILFSEIKNQIRFKVMDDKAKIEDRDIELLSSGEKQVLILLTYLAFETEGSRIFIVDEPELSLHPKWQDEFLYAAKQVMPQNTQLIMATHSPAIVGRNTDRCKVLFPYNEQGGR